MKKTLNNKFRIMPWKWISIKASKHPDEPRIQNEDCFHKNETTNQPYITGIINIKSFLRQMLKAKVFFFITLTSLTFSVLWLQLATTPNTNNVKDSVVKEAIQNVGQDSRMAQIYRKKNKLPKGLKFMLLWSTRDLAPFYFFHKGQEAFIRNNCSVINCYVTSNRNFFDGDVSKFDAIAFNGRSLDHNDLPKHRMPWQKYIYFNMESADNFPVCHPYFDNFFNWTATYKLISDIPFTYILIRRNGQIVGPSIDMNWPAEFPLVNDNLEEKLLNKTRAVAWFVSNCHTRSKREDVVLRLQKALAHYGHSIDVYGACGPFKCRRKNKEACYEKLEKKYYFYLSMENTIADDYVTEKLLTALQHDVVPIVYGGADYSRFLPPNSYLDARETAAPFLASTIDRLMNSPSLYAQYFRWKRLYQYSDPSTRENVCKVCAALNDREMFRKKSVHKEFRKWWLPKFKRRC